MKILFLDFDGVLNNEQEFRRWQKGGKPADLQAWDCIDPKNVDQLNFIVEQTDCRIVVSSTWRTVHTLEWLKNHLERFGFKFKDNIIGITPGNDIIPRGKEIQQWLETEGKKLGVTRHAIVDDNIDYYMQPHVIQTYEEIGLNHQKAKQLVNKLNRVKVPAVDKQQVL